MFSVVVTGSTSGSMLSNKNIPMAGGIPSGDNTMPNIVALKITRLVVTKLVSFYALLLLLQKIMIHILKNISIISFIPILFLSCVKF